MKEYPVNNSAILVTGASGFVGQHLCRYLTSKNKKVIALSRRKNHSPGIDFLQVDLKNQTRLTEIINQNNINTVIHLASQYPPKGQPFDSLSPMFQENTSCLFDILLSMKPGSRFIYASALSVSNGGTWNRPVTEEDALPGDIYSASKLAGEQIANIMSRRTGVSYISLRFSSIYGPDDTHNDVIIPRLIRQAQAGQDLTIHGEGKRVMDLVYIDDVIQAIIKATTSEHQGIFNIGSGQGTTISQLVHTITRIFSSGRSQVHRQNVLEEDTLHLVADISKASRLLDYSPQFDLEQGLKAYQKELDRKEGISG